REACPSSHSQKGDCVGSRPKERNALAVGARSRQCRSKPPPQCIRTLGGSGKWEKGKHESVENFQRSTLYWLMTRYVPLSPVKMRLLMYCTTVICRTWLIAEAEGANEVQRLAHDHRFRRICAGRPRDGGLAFLAAPARQRVAIERNWLP